MRLLLIFSFAIVLGTSYAQEYAITMSTNVYVPMASGKRMYPPFWVKGDYEPKVLLGGFAIGASRTSTLSANVSLRYNASLIRMLYWEEFLNFRDELNIPLGKFPASSIDYMLALGGTAQYKVSQYFYVGGGLGAHAMITSTLYLRKDLGQTVSGRLGKNKAYKPVMPVIPVEISWKFPQWALNFRYEQSVLKRYKSSIAEYKKDRYGLMIFEVAVKLQ
jgi:hypothetical protein